jgi:secreted Zn-dependent insulinase-like peptidase
MQSRVTDSREQASPQSALKGGGAAAGGAAAAAVPEGGALAELDPLLKIPAANPYIPDGDDVKLLAQPDAGAGAGADAATAAAAVAAAAAAAGAAAGAGGAGGAAAAAAAAADPYKVPAANVLAPPTLVWASASEGNGNEQVRGPPHRALEVWWAAEPARVQEPMVDMRCSLVTPWVMTSARGKALAELWAAYARDGLDAELYGATEVGFSYSVFSQGATKGGGFDAGFGLSLKVRVRGGALLLPLGPTQTHAHR